MLTVEVCSGFQILAVLSMCCRLAGLSHTHVPESCCPGGTSGDLQTIDLCTEHAWVS